MLVLLVEADGAGRAQLLAGLALAGLVVGAVERVDDGLVRHGLRERHVDRRALAQAFVELVRDLLLRALLHAEPAAGAELLVELPRLLAHRHLEVADEPVHLLDLAVGHQRDVRVPGRLDHARRQDALRAVQRRERLRELAHVPADARRLLDEHHLVPAVGDVQRHLDAGHAAADHHGGLGDGHLDGEERVVALDLLHQHADEVGALLRGGLALLVHPRAVLAQVRHLAHVRVEPRFFHRPAEGRLVHAGRTRRDHDAVELVLPDRPPGSAAGPDRNTCTCSRRCTRRRARTWTSPRPWRSRRSRRCSRRSDR